MKREVEECLNVTMADTIFVFLFFMPPLFARSSSNELGQLSQHAAPLQSFEKSTGVFDCGVGSISSDIMVH